MIIGRAMIKCTGWNLLGFMVVPFVLNEYFAIHVFVKLDGANSFVCRLVLFLFKELAILNYGQFNKTLPFDVFLDGYFSLCCHIRFV